MHDIVLNVSADSPNMHQVRAAKTMYPVLDAINLAVQTDSVVPATILQPYQNNILVGIPNTTADNSGLFDQNFQTS